MYTALISSLLTFRLDLISVPTNALFERLFNVKGTKDYTFTFMCASCSVTIAKLKNRRTDSLEAM